MSTLVGSATISLPGLVSDPSAYKWFTTIFGILTLSTGILTSINQFMKCAQMSEANRSAMVSYGKLYRVVATELALRRDQRIDAQAFLKTVRTELDRLQDTSPSILDFVLNDFRKEFKDNADLEKPEIAGDLNHVQINRTTKGAASVATPQSIAFAKVNFEET
jgi:outer membrane PBP1 activator LpoA protein